jgi:hypothetical protein
MQLRQLAPWILLLGACSSGGPAPLPEPQVVPDFLLANVNTTSQPQGDISPRDYLGQTSAWYFGSGT